MILKRRSLEDVAEPNVVMELRGVDSWRDLVTGNPHLVDPTYIDQVAKSVVASGAREPLTNLLIPAGQFEGLENLREGLVHSWINSRLRAVMLCMQWALADQPATEAKIYATEAVTAFALRLRGLFPKFIGSEYAETQAQRDALFPIPSEDLQRLSFPSDVFHIVTTNEVLEHVPSIDAALAEMHRVLRPGGWHIGTVPFAHGQYESVVKAKLEGGEIVYLMEPEYHGNPVDERGSLVFEIPGWDILDRAKAVGFREAHVKYIMSSEYACLSNGAGGIFVLCLQK